MSPRRPARRIVESDDESLPETWEEMQRNIEPVSPAAPEQRQVITIEDDDTPQQAPLGGEPSFQVILSMTESTPEPAPEPAQDPAPEPAQVPPPESAPVPPPEPVPESRPPEPAPVDRPESPQPGPSGIEEMNHNAVENEYSDEYFLRTIDTSVGTVTEDKAEFY